MLIKKWLEAGNTIDAELARVKFGCHRLASRISDLRSDRFGNLPIIVTHRAARYGDNYFAEYRLDLDKYRLQNEIN